MSQRPQIKKGQLWRKKHRSQPGLSPFYARVIASKGDRWKTVCSDGNTHTFVAFILQQKFELVF